MNFIQRIRRLNQQMGWQKVIDIQSHQFQLVKKLYHKNGLSIVITCQACPEQYEVFYKEKQVAYFRLRHGEFRVDYPMCGIETIYKAEPDGDGVFSNNERLIYMAKAMRVVLLKIKTTQE